MMKRSIILLATTIALVACTKDEIYSEESNSIEHELSVGIESGTYQTELGTKATTETVVRATWTDGDKVSVINVTKGKLLGGQLAAQGSGTNVSFSGTVTGNLTTGDKLVYVYPAIKSNTTEEAFSTSNQDLSEQTYNSSNTNVVFYGYAEDTYSQSSISKSIKFNLATSYVHLGMSGLTASTPVTEVAISNINGGFAWAIEDGVFKVNSYKENEGIRIECTGITSSANGNAIIRFAIPASPAASRTLTVNSALHTDYATGVRESSTYYNQLYANWISDYEICIHKAGEAPLYTTIATLRDNINQNGVSYKGYTVTVLKDIDLTDNSWVPIGTNVFSSPIYAFSGIFDGNGHTISLVKNNIADDYGLFMTIWGEEEDDPAIIKNLNLDVDLVAISETKTWIGGLTDYAGGYTRFENIIVTGNITTGRYASSLIGYALQYYSVIENCVNKANITAVIPTNINDNYSIIGGLVSQTSCKTVSFINCRNQGLLTADHSKDTDSPSYMGHIVGKGNYTTPTTQNDITMTGCTFSSSAKISGWNVKEGDGNTYPFEGYMTPSQSYTYGTGMPNPGKLMIGGYFGTCDLNGTIQNFIYPNGITQ